MPAQSFRITGIPLSCRDVALMVLQSIQRFGYWPNCWSSQFCLFRSVLILSPRPFHVTDAK
jgi:hypothetical protein